ATSYKLLAVLTDKWSKDAENPQYVVDKKKTAEALSKYIAMDQSEIYERLTKAGLAQVEFGAAGSNLTFDIKRKIEEEKLPGIQFVETPTRLYPNSIFASHLVGLAQLPKTEKENDKLSSSMLTGVLGIESAYDKVLKGQDGYL